MTSSIPSVSPLRQRMLDDMRMRKLSPKTQISYIRSVRQFAAYLKRSPTPQRLMICESTNCIWSTTAPRRSRSITRSAA